MSAPTIVYSFSLHDALPILIDAFRGAVADEAVPQQVPAPQHRPLRPRHRPLEVGGAAGLAPAAAQLHQRSEEHTSELQSHSDLLCRLLLEKKKNWTMNLIPD